MARNILEPYQRELESLCEKFHVKTLELFGSASTGDFDSRKSDLDFLVEFKDISDNQRFDTYFDLLFELEKLTGRKVDLVEVGAMKNPYFIRRVNETRRLVYAA